MRPNCRSGLLFIRSLCAKTSERPRGRYVCDTRVLDQPHLIYMLHRYSNATQVHLLDARSEHLYLNERGDCVRMQCHAMQPKNQITYALHWPRTDWPRASSETIVRLVLCWVQSEFHHSRRVHRHFQLLCRARIHIPQERCCADLAHRLRNSGQLWSNGVTAGNVCVCADAAALLNYDVHCCIHFHVVHLSPRVAPRICAYMRSRVCIISLIWQNIYMYIGWRFWVRGGGYVSICAYKF